MDILALLVWFNASVLAIPMTLLFFGTALFFTFKTRFAQIRAFPRFIRLLMGTLSHQHDVETKEKTMDSFHALFTAMATTMGMGNIVGPSVAIFAGGPGALFWLLVYIFFGSAIKFAEVVFALRTRTTTPEGNILGGPMQYLKTINPLLAYWYGGIMLIMFASWSSLQSNTLASLLELEGVPVWVTGLGVSAFLALVLSGGAQRVGALASKIVPVMFVMYVSVSLIILLSNPVSLINALILIKQSILSPAAAMGGFLGATLFQAMHAGLFQGIFITEAGIGTTSIPHSMADTDQPINQGILAMCATLSDFLLSALSGLLVLVTGVWAQGGFRSTFIYEAFKYNAPTFASYILLGALVLFIITTVMGNGFNGMQTFNSLTHHRGRYFYMSLLIGVVFAGALLSAPLVWEAMKTILIFAAIPNLIGLIILSCRNENSLKIM